MEYRRYRLEFDELGFVVVRNFLGRSELALLKSEVDRVLETVAPTLPDDQIFYYEFPDGRRVPRQIHRMNCDSYFAEYQHNAKWLNLAQELVGEPVTANPPQWLCKPARSSHYSPPHQDNHYYCYRPPNHIMMFLALEEASLASGCIYYLPGSHRGGLRPHEMSGVLGFSQRIVDFDKESVVAVPAELSPGDIACHHAETVHWSEANQSDKDRPALAMTVVGQSCRIDHLAKARYEAEAKQRHLLK